MGKYTDSIRVKWRMDGCRTLAEAAANLREMADELDSMHNDGIVLDDVIDGGYGSISTDDPKLAEKYQMHLLDEEENND